MYNAGNNLNPRTTQHATKGPLCLSKRKVTPCSSSTRDGRAICPWVLLEKSQSGKAWARMLNSIWGRKPDTSLFWTSIFFPCIIDDSWRIPPASVTHVPSRQLEVTSPKRERQKDLCSLPLNIPLDINPPRTPLGSRHQGNRRGALSELP